MDNFFRRFIISNPMISKALPPKTVDIAVMITAIERIANTQSLINYNIHAFLFHSGYGLPFFGLMTSYISLSIVMYLKNCEAFQCPMQYKISSGFRR